MLIISPLVSDAMDAKIINLKGNIFASAYYLCFAFQPFLAIALKNLIYDSGRFAGLNASIYFIIFAIR